jgi:hypothetical protein
VTSDEHFAEQFPLSPADDHLIHQTPDPIRVAWSSDHRVYERYWTVVHDDVGDVIIATGGSFYPNLDTAEAYAIVNYRGRHASVRAFRRLGADRMDLHVGPIRPTIVSGMRLWRYVLEDNQWGISFDLLFEDTHRQVYREPGGSVGAGMPRGRRSDVTTGFEGFGVVDGWVKVEDEVIELVRTSCRGTRDRHWGIGRNVGGPSLQPPGVVSPNVRSGNNFVVFDDFAIWHDRVLYRFGDQRPAFGRIVNIDRRLRFEPETDIFVEGVIDYVFDTGEVKQLHYERLGYQTAYMRCGMYGGTPDKGIHQGQYVGDDVVEGDTHDVTKPEARLALTGLNEHQCRVTCEGETVTGVFQPVDPAAHAACVAGEPGWSLL